MEKRYIAENDIKLEFPKIPNYSKSMLEGKKLKIKEKEISYQKIEYTNGVEFNILDNILTLPNGEKFEGLLTEDKCWLKKGRYYWPNNQIYLGPFDEKNRFSTNEGELAELIFLNGDIYRGEFKEGKIGEGQYITEGKVIRADFTGGKINGVIEYNDTIKGIKFYGSLLNYKKEWKCQTEFKIKDKTFSMIGEYSDGLKNGTFTIREISPNKDNLYIKGKYKQGERNGYFDIIDKEKGINIIHQYISFLQDKLINQYIIKENNNLA